MNATTHDLSGRSAVARFSFGHVSEHRSLTTILNETRTVSIVAIEPSYCHQCGTELARREIHGRERRSCPDCGHRHFRNAVPAVDVIVRADDAVLLIDPVSREEWELPGGHPEFDEEPANAAVRELEEETGIAAHPSSLDLLSAVHSTHRDRHYTMITYAVDYPETDGTPAPGEEAAAVEFWSTARILSSPDATRRIDREAIETMLDE